MKNWNNDRFLFDQWQCYKLVQFSSCKAGSTLVCSFVLSYFNVFDVFWAENIHMFIFLCIIWPIKISSCLLDISKMSCDISLALKVNHKNPSFVHSIVWSINLNLNRNTLSLLIQHNFRYSLFGFYFSLFLSLIFVSPLFTYAYSYRIELNINYINTCFSLLLYIPKPKSST